MVRFGATAEQPDRWGLRGIDQPRPWRIVWTAGTIREADAGECRECDQHRNFRGERLIIIMIQVERGNHAARLRGGGGGYRPGLRRC